MKNLLLLLLLAFTVSISSPAVAADLDYQQHEIDAVDNVDVETVAEFDALVVSSDYAIEVQSNKLDHYYLYKPPDWCRQIVNKAILNQTYSSTSCAPAPSKLETLFCTWLC